MSLLTQEYSIFLTTKPLRRRLTEAQREWLYIQPIQDLNAESLDITIHYTDGTSHNYDYSIGDLRTYETVIVPVDFTSRAYNSINPAKTIRTITIKLNSQPEDIIVYERWVPQSENIIELHYFNSLGGLDSFIATGDTADGTDFTRLIGKKFVQEGYLARLGAYYADNQRSRDRVEINSGFKPVDEIRATVDMLHTNKIHRLVDTDGTEQLLPYIWDGTAMELPAANNNLKAISFTLQAAWEEKARARVV